MKKHLITGFVIASMMPALALAQTSDVQAQIQSLVSQIQSLQQQLQTLLASTAPQRGNMLWMDASSTMPSFPGAMAPGQVAKMTCIALTRNLSVGSKGEDVKKLQELLASDPQNDFRGQVTGFFGPLTANAMMKFQARMGIHPSDDGSVGPLTRGFFERVCGKGLSGDHGGALRGAAITGTITAVSSSSIAVAERNGMSRTITISASTTIMVSSGTSTAPTAGTTADLIVGKTVTAKGEIQGDNTLNATHVLVGVMMPTQLTMPQGQRPQGILQLLGAPGGGRGSNHGPQNY